MGVGGILGFGGILGGGSQIFHGRDALPSYCVIMVNLELFGNTRITNFLNYNFDSRGIKRVSFSFILTRLT